MSDERCTFKPKVWTLDLNKHSPICMLRFGGYRCSCGGRRRCTEAKRIAIDLMEKGWRP